MPLPLGELLRDLRETANLTQTELGKKVHMTQRKISHIETGGCEPGIDDLKAFCLFFGVSSDYLLSLPEKLKYPKK